MQLAIDWQSEPNLWQIIFNIFCRIYPTFWYAATSLVSAQWKWWIPANIYPISTSARYYSFMIIPLFPIPVRSDPVISSGVHIICSYCVDVLK